MSRDSARDGQSSCTSLLRCSYSIDVELLNLLPSCNNDTVDLERGTAARPQTNNLEANTAYH